MPTLFPPLSADPTRGRPLRCVVLTAARTGSTMLVSMLAAQPGVHFHGEVFNREGVKGFRGARTLRDLIGVDPTELRERDPVRFVDTVFALSPTHVRVVGFKLFLTNAAVAERVLADPAIRVILLDRANRLASFSSMLVARETGRWSQRSGDATPAERPRVAFDGDAIDRYVRARDREQAAATARLAVRGNALALDYAELTEPATHADLAAFLGLDQPAPMVASTVRQNPGALLDRFADPAAVAAHLAATGRTAWLTEQ